MFSTSGAQMSSTYLRTRMLNFRIVVLVEFLELSQTDVMLLVDVLKRFLHKTHFADSVRQSVNAVAKVGHTLFSKERNILTTSSKIKRSAGIHEFRHRHIQITDAKKSQNSTDRVRFEPSDIASLMRRQYGSSLLVFFHGGGGDGDGDGGLLIAVASAAIAGCLCVARGYCDGAVTN